MLLNDTAPSAHAGPLRLLLLTNSMDVGGIETNLLLLCQRFVARGHAVTLGARPGVLEPDVRKTGARFLPLEVRLRERAARRRDVAALRRVLDEERPHVVHVFSASTAILLRLARRGRDVRVVASPMGLQDAPDESYIRTQARNAAMAWTADRTLVISPEIGRMLRGLVVRRSRLVALAVVGVELPRAANGRRPTAPSRPLVLTIGALAPRKSHELFIAMAERVLAKGRDADFSIAGSGPLRGDLDRHIQASGRSNRIRLLGYEKDLEPLFARTSVYVKPGVVEGFIGITVLEAQARGIPVVAFETQDVKLAIEDGVTGLLAPNGDVEALAALVMRLLDNEALARQIGEAGQRRVEERFAIDRVVDGLLAFYRSQLIEVAP